LLIVIVGRVIVIKVSCGLPVCCHLLSLAAWLSFALSVVCLLSLPQCRGQVYRCELIGAR
jgi:hypothetical protein